MDDISDGKTITPKEEDKTDSFLISELENAISTLTFEREMADRMVNHFFTLVVASIGGFVYLITTTKDGLNDLMVFYVLPIGFVLLVLGCSVFIRLIKRHFDGKVFQRGRKELYSTIKNRYKGTSLQRYYQSMDDFNYEFNKSINVIKNEFDKPSWFSKKTFLFMYALHKDLLPHLGGAGAVIALVNCITVSVFSGYFFHLIVGSPNFVLFAIGIGLLAMVIHVFIYFSKRYVVNAIIKRWESKLNSMDINQDIHHQVKSLDLNNARSN